MNERSVFNSSFLSLVEKWIAESGEIYIVIRYSHMAGSKDYLLMHSFLEFLNKLRTLPAQADVIVFRQKQLPIRGIANEDLLEAALDEIPDGIEWKMEEYNPQTQTINRWIWGGAERKELIKTFNENKGLSLAVGKTPTWWEDDNEDMQSALVPMKDGALKRGIY